MRDELPLLSSRERKERLDVLKRYLDIEIAAFGEALSGAPGAVHNFAPPSISPFGRSDHREDFGLRVIVSELNQHVDARVRECGTLEVVDEERLAARYGTVNMFDDERLPFSHHGGAFDPAIEIPHQGPLLTRVLANEYLDLYELSNNAGAVKLLAIQPDGVLWPTRSLLSGFEWLHRDTTSRWMYLGVHQAVKILKARGVDLVLLLDGDTAVDGLASWRAADHRRLLGPDDFTLARNVDGAGSSLVALADRRGLEIGQIALLTADEGGAADLRRRVPGIVTVSGRLSDLRKYLLTEPRFETPAAGTP